MRTPIGVRETTEGNPWDRDLGDALALRVDASRRVMLRFELAVQGSENLEALRYARRSMIREERTRGLEWDEPSMEDPTFSGTEIRWFVLASQAAWCRERIAELVERANRAIAALRDPRGR
ncbi:MAG: hypothetical protein WEB59_11665 [Thermoanaerobaculia bacterium]